MSPFSLSHGYAPSNKIVHKCNVVSHSGIPAAQPVVGNFVPTILLNLQYMPVNWVSLSWNSLSCAHIFAPRLRLKREAYPWYRAANDLHVNALLAGMKFLVLRPHFSSAPPLEARNIPLISCCEWFACKCPAKGDAFNRTFAMLFKGSATCVHWHVVRLCS